MRFLLISIALHISISSHGQGGLLDDVRSRIGAEWIQKNPEFTTVQPSYFSDVTNKEIYIAAVGWSGLSIPFFWDCDLGGITFLTKNYRDSKKATGTEANKTFEGVKVTWTQEIPATLIANGKVHQGSVDSWSLFEFTECPGTITFPMIVFEKLFDLENPLTNDLSGYVIIGEYLDFPDNPSSYNGEMTTNEGQPIAGKFLDLDNDDIPDIFEYTEPVGDDLVHAYKRVYVNTDGKWKCVYVEFLEVCV